MCEVSTVHCLSPSVLGVVPDLVGKCRIRHDQMGATLRSLTSLMISLNSHPGVGLMGTFANPRPSHVEDFWGHGSVAHIFFHIIIK